jgi:5-hydroxyisourate hydrolase-like protein (transthyretin family)
MAFSIKNGDTAPAYVVDLQDDVDTTPVAINLTSATSVTFKMRLADTSGVPAVDAVMDITTAASGRVTYEWAPGDTDETGTYDVEFEILWNDGTIETVPNSGYNTVIVTDDLDD